ncbi:MULTISPECIES: glycosyltransferase family 2 protein [unclassified Devosia]|uniref:glycosyltransferase family 2 protein n=1 Tax=unclassified Devosia TaxID=196773 RepID=UPI001556CA51|nr:MULTISPECIES: glycosyltransferase family 2 protein [unclassified Devosia]
MPGHSSTSGEQILVAVVIPFYQKEAGILARALRSVAAQELAGAIKLTVIVVDDASPIRASDELALVRSGFPHELILIEQSNGGPGAARNTGIDRAVELGAEFIAFLDSDDEWAPPHLQEALECLGSEASFYFCDHTRQVWEHSLFGELNTMAEWQRGASGVVWSGTRALVDRETLLAAYLREYLSQTSTVVYRLRAAPDMRFDTSLRAAGEDYLFWIKLGQLAGGASFSCSVNVVCGTGVNIYMSAFDWSKKETVSRYGYLKLLWHRVLSEVELDDEQRDIAGRTLKLIERAYTFLLLRQLIRLSLPDLGMLRKLAAADPSFPFRFPVTLCTAIATVRRDAANW